MLVNRFTHIAKKCLQKHIALRNHPAGVSFYSTKVKIAPDDIQVSEIKIQTPNGDTLAGKLWKNLSEAPPEPNVSEQVITPIVCSHGWLDNCGSFDALIPLILEPNMTFFALDFPGHGLSSHTNASQYDLHFDAVINLHRVMKHFNWPKITLMGHSLGAITSFIFAGCFPELVTGLLTMDNINPVPGDYIEAMRFATKSMFELEDKMAKRPQPEYTKEEILNRFYEARGRTITKEGCELLLKRGSKPAPNDPSKFIFAHDMRVTIPSALYRLTEQQSHSIARSIKCPVCVLKGEPGNDYEPREKFMQMVDLLSDNAERVEFHLIPGTHHFHLNEPHLIASIITKFLKS